MTILRWALASLAASAVLGAAAQPAGAPACAASEHRQFDFWLGEWEVRDAAGRVVGINRIEKAFADCVIRERYETARGYRGESLNAYDAGRRQWHQTWVDNSGTLLLLDGGLRDGRMLLEGRTVGRDGAVASHRITWTPNADGSVRQVWETTDAAGAWTISFDGRYTRR